MKFAEVAVNSPLAQRRSFSYSIPPHLSVVAGQAVWVPFGPRVLQGVALKITDAPGVPQTRDIIDVIDPEPLLSPAQTELALWISQHYLSPLFNAVALMLPPGFERRLISYLQATDREVDSPLTSPQRQVLAILQKKGKVRLEEIEKALGKKQAQAVIGQLLRRNLISKAQVLSPSKVRPKLSSFVRLKISTEQANAMQQSSRLGAKQAALLELLMAEGRPLLLTEAWQRVGCLPSTVK
jgi:primosomal protein N' (replication factor Y)